jgi:queuosine precursor transporter
MSRVTSLSLADTIVVGLYVGAELAANVTEAKPVQVLGLVVDGGTLIYALTFTLLDLVHERQGKRGAQKVVVAAFAANVLLAAYVQLTIRLPFPAFFQSQLSYEQVLGATSRIVIASLAAFLLSSLVDAEVYAWIEHRIGGYRWIPVLGSNAVGTLLDSVLFITLAFYGRFPLLSLILGNYAIKMFVTVVSLPLIYARPRSW